MIWGVILMVAANGAVGLGAGALVRKLGTGRGELDVVLFLVLRILLISAVLVIAGVTGGLTRNWLGLGGAGVLGVLLATGGGKPRTGIRIPAIPRWIWVLTAGVMARLLAQVWWFAPHLGDPLCYHLPKVAEWIRAGRFTREMGLHPHVTFPAGFELIETWWTLFLHHDVLIELAGVEFLVLAFAATYSLARSLGQEADWAWLAGLGYVLVPGLHLGATSCLNDAAAAAIVVALAAAIVGRVPAPLLGVMVALGAGIKPTTLYALPGMGVLYLWERKEHRPPSLPPRSGALAWGLAVLALGVGAYWYIRNWIWFGNPVYPVHSPGYEQLSVAIQAAPRWRSLLANVEDLLGRRISDAAAPLGGNVDYSAGWGPVAFACGLIAVPCLWSDRPLRRLVLSFVVALGSTLLWSQSDAWCLKYAFYFPVVLVLASTQLCSMRSTLRPLWGVALAGSFVLTTLSYDLRWRTLRFLATQGWRERTVEVEPASVRSQDLIACAGGSFTRSYLLYRPDFSRRVVYLRATDPDVFRKELLGSGARTLYVGPLGSGQDAILKTCLARGDLRPLGESFFAIGSVGDRPP